MPRAVPCGTSPLHRSASKSFCDQSQRGNTTSTLPTHFIHSIPSPKVAILAQGKRSLTRTLPYLRRVRKRWVWPLGILIGILSLWAWQDPLYRLGRNIEIYGRVLQELALNYVDEPDLDRLTTRAIESMLGDLDPYTNFYSAVDVTQGQLEQSGRYAGIGIGVQEVAGRKVVYRVFAEGPAEKAGIRPGDLIVEIEDQQAANLSLEKVQALLRGAPGTKVRLLLERPAEKRRFPVQVSRAEIEPSAIPYATLLPGDIGYIALSQFSRNCAESFRQELIQLKTQAPLKGLIIDLRGNPGGLLQEALEVLNLFLPKGELLLETRGRMPEASQKYHAQMHPFEPNLPLVILIDEQSASASEIVAGTFQDLDRAVIMGHRSFGKGLVQVVRPLVENTQMKITVSRYYTPSGRCIQLGRETQQVFKTRSGRLVREANGILPDIVLPSALPIALKNTLTPYFFLFSAYLSALPDTITLRPLPESFAQTVLDSIARHPEAFTDENDRLLALLEKQNDTLAPVRTALNQVKTALFQTRLGNLQKALPEVSFLVTQNVLYRQAGEKWAYAYAVREDPWIQEARRLLESPQRYQAILKP